MKRSAVLLILAVFSAAHGGGITMGFMSGLNPNLLHFNTSVTKSQIQLGNYADADNLARPGNSAIGSTSSSIIGVPIGLNLRYLEKWYIIRLGFLYHFSLGGTNTITTNSLSAAKNVEESYSMRMAEIPLTFAFNIRNDAYTRFYAGAGPTLFFGSARILTNNGSGDKLADEDIYSGWALGAHLLLGGEVSVSQSVSLSVEMVFNYGNKAPVSDEAITENTSVTPQDNENKKAPGILGIYDAQKDVKLIRYNPEHPTGLDFSGIEMIISFNYFLGAL